MTLVGAIATATAVVALALLPQIGSRPAIAIGLRHPDAGALDEAGWRHGVRGWLGIETAAIVAGAAACILFGVPLLAVAGCAAAPSVWIRLRAEAARSRADRALGGIVAAAEASLRSGMSLPEALRRAADASADEAAARPIRAAIRSFDLGASLDEALRSAAEAARDPRTRVVLTTLALGIGERLPRERIADLLAAIGERVGFEDRLADEVRARAAGARQQQRILAAVVPGLALYLAATMPVLSATLGTDLGRFVLIPAATALEVAGVVMGRRIVSGALG